MENINEGINRKKYNEIISIEKDLNLGYELELVNEVLDNVEKRENGKYYLDSKAKSEIIEGYIPQNTKKLMNLYNENLNLLDYIDYAKQEGLLMNNDKIEYELKIGIYEYNENIVNFILFSLYDYEIELY